MLSTPTHGLLSGFHCGGRTCRSQVGSSAAIRDNVGVPRWVKVSKWAAIVVVVAVIAGLVTGYWTVRRSFPQTSGTVSISGLDAPVSVLRDDHGIPQIYAETPHDLFLAQGYVQAQDRFFEMDFRRHVTAGRISELLGEDALDVDKFVRASGWRRVAEEELPLLSPDTRHYLEYFSEGVNAYLDERQGSRLSLEYAVLGSRRRRGRTGGVDAGRLAGLAEGDVVESRHQHRRRARALARRRRTSRPSRSPSSSRPTRMTRTSRSSIRARSSTACTSRTRPSAARGCRGARRRSSTAGPRRAARCQVGVRCGQRAAGHRRRHRLQRVGGLR